MTLSMFMIPKFSCPHDTQFRIDHFPQSAFNPSMKRSDLCNTMKKVYQLLLGSIQLLWELLLTRHKGLTLQFCWLQVTRTEDIFLPRGSEEESSSMPLQLPRAAGFVRLIATFFRFHNKEEKIILHLVIFLVLCRQRMCSALKDACCPLAWVHFYNPAQPNLVGVFVFSHLNSNFYDAVWYIHRLYSLGHRYLWGHFAAYYRKITLNS